MSDRLTFGEKRYINKFLEESKPIDTNWLNWASWVLVFFGGIVMVIACLTALNNLGAPNLESVFRALLVVGSILLLGGVYLLRLVKKAEETQLLRSALKKLLP